MVELSLDNDLITPQRTNNQPIHSLAGHSPLVTFILSYICE